MCENCKTVSYCSKEHQKVDWVKHKGICKIISDLEKIFITVKMDNLINNRFFYLSKVVHYWKLKLKRDIFNGELNMVAFRRFCIVCSAKKCPIQCTVCLSVFYCSDKHQKIHREKHEQVCQLLKLNFDLSLFNYKNSISLPKFTTIPIRHGLVKLPRDLMELINIFMKELYVVFTKTIETLEAYSLIDLFAPPANIIFGLEKANLLKNRKFRKNKLVIHIVGADEEEQSWNWGFFMEFMFHWIKNLEKLTVVVIGPNIKPLKKLFNLFGICGRCNVSSSNAICFSLSNFYHNLDNLSKPDIVVGFNCGIFLFPSWKKSIPKLLKHSGVPLLLTDYTLDWLQKDLSVVKNNTSKKIKIIVNPKKNAFRCISPYRSVDVIRNPICYKNAFIILIVAK